MRVVVEAGSCPGIQSVVVRSPGLISVGVPQGPTSWLATVDEALRESFAVNDDGCTAVPECFAVFFGLGAVVSQPELF